MFSSSFDDNHGHYHYQTYDVPSAVPIIPYALVSPYGQYPSHGQFSTMMTYEGESPRLVTSQHQKHQHAAPAHKGRVHFAEQSHQHAPQAHKARVHFAEQATVTDHAPQARKGRVHFEENSVTEALDQKNGRVKVHQDNIDADADGFIRLKHKNFELSKWETFKGY